MLASWSVGNASSKVAAEIAETRGLLFKVASGDPAAARGGGNSEADGRDEAFGDREGDESVAATDAAEVGVVGNSSGDWL